MVYLLYGEVCVYRKYTKLGRMGYSVGRLYTNGSEKNNYLYSTCNFSVTSDFFQNNNERSLCSNLENLLLDICSNEIIGKGQAKYVQMVYKSMCTDVLNFFVYNSIQIVNKHW